MFDFVVLSLEAPYHRRDELYESRKWYSFKALGPHKIAWIAREHGYRSIAISRLQFLTVEEIVKLIEPLINTKTVIGVSTAFIQIPINQLITKKYVEIPPTRELFKLKNAVDILRAKHNNKVVVGGSVGQIFHDFFRADQSFSGEAENIIVKYLDQHFRSGIQKKPYDWNIGNCNFRWHESDCVQTNEVLPLEMSRGCMFKCKFCAWEMIGKKRGTYERSIESIKNELLYNHDHFNTTGYVLASDTLNEDNQRMNEWCDMLEALPFKIRYAGFARLDLAYAHQTTTRRLYETGLTGLQFGIETFHYDAAKAIGKGFNGKYGKQALEHLFYTVFEKNVAFFLSMIIGLPGETLESIYESHEFYKKHPNMMGVFYPLQLQNPKFVPDHYYLSEFSKNVQQHGYRFIDNSVVDWESDIMSWQQALDIADELVKRTDHSASLHGWGSVLLTTKSGLEPKHFFESDLMVLQNEITAKILTDHYRYFELLKNYLLKL